MPVYEYQCFKCGARFDRWQRFGDPGPSTCPNGHSEVHRVLSAPAIIFKGSGFYATDHGRNGGGTSSRKHRQEKKESEPAAGSTADEHTEP